jgi:hypothetical protein
MRSVPLSVVALTLFAAPAAAFGAPDDDPMAGYYGNTTISTGGKTEVHFVYNSDHTFILKVPAYGMEFKGTWAVNGSTICFNYDTPPPGLDNPDCAPLVPHKVGDTWTLNDNGRTRTITLVKGVQ